MKRNKLEKDQIFKADMQTIKKEDVRKLQKTFDRFFGANPDEMKKYSSKLRNKVYFFGFIASVIFVLVLFLSKNVKFVGL